MSVRELGSQGGELFGRGELLSTASFQLSFSQHVHQFDADKGGLRRVKRFESEHGPGDPLHPAMVLFDDVIEILDLTNLDGGAVLVIVALDRGFIGRTPIDGDLLRYTMTADRLGEKPLGCLLVTLLREEEINGLPGLSTARYR